MFDLAGATDGSASGVYMVRNRVYDPGMGRWLERDPIVYWGGQNLLAYVGGHATMKIDPTGLASEDPSITLHPEKDFTEIWNGCSKASDVYKAVEARFKKSCKGSEIEFDGYLDDAEPYPGWVSYTDDGSWVRLYLNIMNIPSGDFDQLCSALAHELLHLSDACDREKNGEKRGCKQTACTESRANAVTCSNAAWRKVIGNGKSISFDECMSKQREGYANNHREECTKDEYLAAWDRCKDSSNIVAPGCGGDTEIGPLPVP